MIFYTGNTRSRIFTTLVVSRHRSSTVAICTPEKHVFFLSIVFAELSRRFLTQTFFPSLEGQTRKYPSFGNQTNLCCPPHAAELFKFLAKNFCAVAAGWNCNGLVFSGKWRFLVKRPPTRPLALLIKKYWVYDFGM
jgi:hypothetical protein